MKYVFGRGNWLESVAVGVVGGIALVVACPLMLVAGFIIFIAGITGFLKRAEQKSSVSHFESEEATE